ncbi:hypothetical protein VTN00DRAFT_9508 [Thermoascus crustaceus]|uniref:uncharacterized protein n=1 Tax=Thermoascus crustaceus TaxID=5088 RepID=UPI0037426256
MSRVEYCQQVSRKEQLRCALDPTMEAAFLVISNGLGGDPVLSKAYEDIISNRFSWEITRTQTRRFTGYSAGDTVVLDICIFHP